MIRLLDLAIGAGDFRQHHLSMSAATGEYVVLMGKTGVGKTTLLETLCGLRPAFAGGIEIEGRDATSAPPAARGAALVPQDAALFPTMTVADQLAFPMRIAKHSRAAYTARVRGLAALLGIEHLLARKPKGLSGGERQRIALGRALSAGPRVLCLDEPFSALDDDTRLEMYSLVESLRAARPFTALHVTHRREEADRLGDRVLTLTDQGLGG